MKKALFLVLSLSLLLFPAACGEESEISINETLELSPLIQLSVEEGASDGARLFYLEKSVGVLYLHPDEGGFNVGFVSSHRSISAEQILHGEGAVSAVSVREEAKDRIFISVEKGVYTLIMDGNTADSSFTPYPEKAAAERYGFFDDLTVYAEAKELLLLLPVNMSETYVLANRELLIDFASVLTVSDNGKKIWYTRSENGEYTGIAFFEYGKNTTLGNENFGFDSARAVGDGKVLFTRKTEDGACLYLYRDLENATAFSVMSETLYDEVSITPDGSLLVGVKAKDGKGVVDIFQTESGKKTGSLPIEFGTPCPAVCLQSDGGKIFLAVGSGTDLVLGEIKLN